MIWKIWILNSKEKINKTFFLFTLYLFRVRMCGSFLFPYFYSNLKNFKPPAAMSHLPSWLGEYRIYCLDLCRGGKTLPLTSVLDGEVPIILKLQGMWNNPSLPSLPGPHWAGVVALDRVLSTGQIELNCVLILNWIVWNRTVLTFSCV